MNGVLGGGGGHDCPSCTIPVKTSISFSLLNDLPTLSGRVERDDELLEAVEGAVRGGP